MKTKRIVTSSRQNGIVALNYASLYRLHNEMRLGLARAGQVSKKHDLGRFAKDARISRQYARDLMGEHSYTESTLLRAIATLFELSGDTRDPGEFIDDLVQITRPRSYQFKFNAGG